MRLVEGVGRKLLPVRPYLLKHFRVVAVFLSSLNELRLHGIYDGLLFLSHCLTQGVALATGEVGKLAAQKHHLLLIDSDAVGVLEIFLHAGNVVCHKRRVMLSLDEVGDVVHRSRTV